MKICLNCTHWTPEKKGLCQRVMQGTGKFFSCSDWREDPTASDERQPAAFAAAAGHHRSASAG